MCVLGLMMVLVYAASLEHAEAVVPRSRTAPSRSRQAENTWVWRCEQGNNCVQYDSGTGEGYSSQDVCRLLCGVWGPLWPRPNVQPKLGSRLATVDVSSVTFSPSDDPLLVQMQDLFLHEISLLACGHANCPPCHPTDTCFSLALDFTIDDMSVKSIEWDMDEGYSLEMMHEANTLRAEIVAGNVFGARHAMQTLSQLMVRGDLGHAFIMRDAQVLYDKPKFSHRGVMIDTARHFIPLTAIQRTIDAMSTCKLNTLHLHLTDSHSFPFKSERVPQMSKWGAYSAAETYSPSDLAQLSQYALVRGVRIIPEIDAPAHAGNGWQWGTAENQGELAVCVNQKPWREMCIQPPCGQLHPGNSNVYRILGELYGELKNALEPHAKSVFHLGGDEVFINCWRSSPNVSAWLASIPGHEALTDDDFHWAWKHFQDEAQAALDTVYGNSNTSIILWSSALTDPHEITQNLDPKRYVIQTWVPENETLPQELLDLQYRVIVSNKDAWYLDWGFWGRTTYSTWKRVYDAKLPDGALGGEVCLWSELIDEYSMDSLLWPRAAALAERLWSNPAKEEKAEWAEARLLHWRRRIIDLKGVNPSAIAPQWCELHEADCF